MGERVRFGIAGTNFISEWFIEAGRHDPRFEVAAVCSRTEGRAKEFAAKFGIPNIFTSFEQMVASDSIDAVYVATPNSLHASQSISAMKAGKHVLCEKPLASNAREAEEMIRTSAEQGVALMEAMRIMFAPAISAVRENIGRIGVPRLYSATYCQYSSRYDRFMNGELPNAFNPEFSAGALMDIGCYTVYPMLAMFGMPRSVHAVGVKLSSGVDGQGSVVFGYPDMDAVVSYSKISDSSLCTEIQGEDGSITIDAIGNPRRAVFRHRTQNAGGGRGSMIREEILADTEDVGDYRREISEFIDVVQSGRRESAVTSHAVSLAVMRVLDAIREQLGVEFPADSTS